MHTYILILVLGLITTAIGIHGILEKTKVITGPEVGDLYGYCLDVDPPHGGFTWIKEIEGDQVLLVTEWFKPGNYGIHGYEEWKPVTELDSHFYRKLKGKHLPPKKEEPHWFEFYIPPQPHVEAI